MTYHKDGLSLEIDVLREGVLALDGVGSLVQLELSGELDGVDGEGSVLVLEHGSETRELGQGSDGDVCKPSQRQGERGVAQGSGQVECSGIQQGRREIGFCMATIVWTKGNHVSIETRLVK